MMKITWADGSNSTLHNSYDDARAAVKASYPDAEIGHPGDLLNGGGRTLCWADAASAVDATGQWWGGRAIASIVRA